MKPRTLLLGLDGATFTILDPLMAAGEMPFFKELVDTGVRAELRSVVPALTPPAKPRLRGACATETCSKILASSEDDVGSELPLSTTRTSSGRYCVSAKARIQRSRARPPS